MVNQSLFSICCVIILNSNINLFFFTFAATIEIFHCGKVLFRIKDIFRAFIPFYVIMHDRKNITKNILVLSFLIPLYILCFSTLLWCQFTKKRSISSATSHKIRKCCKKSGHIFMMMWHSFLCFIEALRTVKFSFDKFCYHISYEMVHVLRTFYIYLYNKKIYACHSKVLWIWTRNIIQRIILH